MLSRVTVRASDLDASARAYAALLGPLGLRLEPAADGLARARAGGRMRIADTQVTEHVALAFPADADRTLRDPDGNEVVLTPAR